jgi:hypothetical protein
MLEAQQAKLVEIYLRFKGISVDSSGCAGVNPRASKGLPMFVRNKKRGKAARSSGTST